MVGSTDPAAVYFQNGFWVWDGSQWIKIEADAGGAVKVVLHGQDADIEVTQTTPADLCVGPHGWDGSAWHKLAMLWGYSDDVLDGQMNASASTGTNTLAHPDVATGEVWVITHMSARNATSAYTRLYFIHDRGGSERIISGHESPAQNEVKSDHCFIVLEAGDNIEARFFGCTAGDSIRSWIYGYKMKVAE